MKANMRLFGEGLLTSEGDFWLRQRRLTQPAFHRARVAAYGTTMVEYAERAMRGWKSGEVRDIHEDMMQITLQIVGKTLFNAGADARRERSRRDDGSSAETGGRFWQIHFDSSLGSDSAQFARPAWAFAASKKLFTASSRRSAPKQAIPAICFRCCLRCRTKTALE